MTNENDEVADSLSELQHALTALEIAQARIIRRHSASPSFSAHQVYKFMAASIVYAHNAYRELTGGRAPERLTRAAASPDAPLEPVGTRAALQELVSAMERYQEEQDFPPNSKHNAMMQRAYSALANAPSDEAAEEETVRVRVHSIWVPNAPLLADWQSKSVPEMEAAVEAHCVASGGNPAHKIERIKAYRKLTAQGLAESLKWVDSHFKH